MSETKTPVEPLSAEDIIERLCALQQEVYQHLDYDKAADCFCGKGGFWKSEEYGGTFDQGYRNSGECLGFIESAVREKLTAPAPAEAEGELARLQAENDRLREQNTQLKTIYVECGLHASSCRVDEGDECSCWHEQFADELALLEQSGHE